MSGSAPRSRRRVQALFDAAAGSRSGTLAGRLLGSGASVYGAWQRLRPRLYRAGWLAARRLPCPVLSIGNLTLGGTGKTPLTIELGRRLRARGLRLAVLSRGYKGGLERRGGVVCDGAGLRLSATHSGDEPYLIGCRLKSVPVIVGGDRFRSGLLAWDRFRPDLVLLDDGFQHLRLERDLDLLLFDWRRPFGNGGLLPAGPLREPVTALARADAIVVTRAPEGAAAFASGAAERIVKTLARGPVFFTAHRPYAYAIPCGSRLGPEAFASAPAFAAPADWRRRGAFAFSGIASHSAFIDTLSQLGLPPPVGDRAFPDHHVYTAADVQAVTADARRCGADLLVTTDKDHARFFGRVDWPLDQLVVGVRISFGAGEAAFEAFLDRRLKSLLGFPEGDPKIKTLP